MSAINNGNQVLTYDYKQSVTSQGFNKLNYKLHPKGIYEGGEIVKVNDTEIRVQPFICLYEENTNKVSVKIETETYAVVAVSASTPYIVGRFVWLNTEDNYMDIIAIAQVEVLSTDLIFARLQFNGATLLTDIDYSETTYSSKKSLKLFNTIPFLVTPTYPNSDTIKVGVGGPFIVDGRKVEITVEQTSSSISLPIGVSRKDLVVINPVDNTISVLTGTTEIPVLTQKYLPIAILNLPSDCTSIKGSYIQYISPSIFKSSNTSSADILTLTLAQDGASSGLDGYYLDGVSSFNIKAAIEELAVSAMTETNMTSTKDWAEAVAGNNIIVATHRVAGSFDNTYATSTDGITWTNRTFPIGSGSIGTSWNPYFCGGIFFVTVGSTGELLYGIDGINWTQITMPFSYTYNGFVYGNDIYICFRSGTSDIYLTSDNGVDWTPHTLPSAIGTGRVAFGNNTFVILTATGTTLLSSDGINWIDGGSLAGFGLSRYITFGNNIFTAINNSSSICATSVDGVDWTIGSLSSSSDWNKLIFGNKVFCASINNANTIATSTDGLNWRSHNLPSTQEWRGLTYLNGAYSMFVINSNYAIYSVKILI